MQGMYVCYNLLNRLVCVYICMYIYGSQNKQLEQVWMGFVREVC